jgi:MFS family permease
MQIYSRARPTRQEQILTAGQPSYSTLLRNRSFSALWVSQLVSQSGDAVFDVALLWLVLVTTGSTALVGVTQAAVLLPSVLASPVAGVYADRLNRRNLMIASNLTQGAVTAVISLFYLSGALSFPSLIFLVLVLYTGTQFFSAANTAIIPRIVGKENLGAANGLFMLSASANQLASYSVGGIVLATVGAGASITYDSLTFFFAAAMLMLVTKTYGQPRGASAVRETPRSGEKGFWREFREGFHYVRQSRVFLELIVFGVLVNFFGAGLAVLMAPYVKVWIHGGASVYGFTLASFALGTIVGSLAIGKVNFRGYLGRLLFIGVAVTGALVILAGLVTSIPSAFVIFSLLGAMLAVINLPINVLVQTQVPGEILGRAATVMRSLLVASQPVAAVVFGFLAGVTAIGPLFVYLGFALMIVASLLFIPFVELRRARY